MDLNRSITVQEAATRLHVSPAHIRELVQSGQLSATKHGQALLVDTESVDRRAQVIRPKPGRPLSPRMAWALLWLAGGHNPEWINPVELARVRKYLKRPPVEWPRLLAKRAHTYPVRMLPGPLKRLRESTGVCEAGISAAARYQVDLVPAGEEVELYVTEELFDHLRDTHRINVDTTRPNVTLRVPQFVDRRLELGAIAPPAVVAADLLESGDSRSADAAVRLLGRLHIA